MKTRSLAATVLASTVALASITPASADEVSLSSMLNTDTFEALSSGISSGKSVRLALAEAAAEQRINSLSCEKFSSGSKFLEQVLGGKPNYTTANTIASTLIEAGLLDKEINQADLDGADRSAFKVFLRHIFLERAVSCDFISDPDHQAEKTKEQRSKATESTSSSGSFSS